MSSQISPSACGRLVAGGIGLAAALSLLSVSPAFAGGPEKGGGHANGFAHSSFLQLARGDDHFFHHMTDHNRHCHDGHGHDAEHNPHCHPMSP